MAMASRRSNGYIHIRNALKCSSSSPPESMGLRAQRSSTSGTAGLFEYQIHAALNYEHAQHFGLSFVRFYANTSMNLVKDLDCSLEVKDLYEKFTNEVKGKRPVPPALMHNIFEQCNSREDVELAFQILQEYRIYRSSKARVKHNFKDSMSVLAVLASLRSKSYGLGLKALWRHNVYGLSPNLQNAHMFLSHARQERDVDLMRKTFETMIKNVIIPTTQTADIMIRICKDNEDIELMFTLADEFLQNEVKLGSSLYDILIATAANFGHIEKVFKAQKWREDAGLDHTIASAFAIAKVHILQGEAQIAANLIAEHCKDKSKVNKYLTMLVRLWPAELLQRKQDNEDEGLDNLSNLKENVLLFAKTLSKQFYGVSIDAEEYGRGRQKLNREDGAD